MIGAEGDVRMPLNPIGQVFLEGSLWRARASEENPIDVGNRVRVESVEGLTLEVRPLAGETSETEAEEE
jgi:membrane protein implicated in regulation of membrane protease activity